MEQGTQLLTVMYGFNVAGRASVGLLQFTRKISAVRLHGAVIFGGGVAAFGFTLLDYIGDGKI